MATSPIRRRPKAPTAAKSAGKPPAKASAKTSARRRPAAPAPASDPGLPGLPATETAARDTAPIEFVVDLPATGERGAASGGPRRLRATPGQDLLAVTVANGLSPDFKLYLSPEDARDLFQAQAPGSASRGARTAVPGEVPVPALARWRAMGAPAASRGELSDLFFKAVDVLGLRDKAGALGAKLLAAKLDGQVDEGVYRLLPGRLDALKGSGRKVARMDAAPNGQPTLVLVHGTFVETVSTFGAWWSEHGGLVDGLFKGYDNRVYALDHRTLGASPIDNALSLAQACPPGARLHLVTHSRGGLVAEVMARVCGRNGQIDEALPLFQGPAYAAHRTALAALGQLVRERGIQVERVVRVACPAHGTLLASERFSAYLSAVSWLLEKAGGPLGVIAAQLVDFAKAVANERTRPDALPGIEAMMPGRPVATWLNQRQLSVPGRLRVVAGDLQGDSMVSWLKVLLADGFYWTDNDLVVNTNSMYGGSSREGEASFLLERSGGTDHFHYFRNASTARAIQQALLLEAPEGFLPIGPLSRSGQSASGERGLLREDSRITDATARALKADGQRPALLLLPGILGSHLRGDDGRDWFALLKLPGLMDRIAWQGAADRIREDGPMADYYADLAEAMERSHDVIGFGFDWRRPLEDEALRLAACVRRELDRRQASGQPVCVLAHSMGGLLLRTLQLVEPKVWQALVQHPGARLLMLGTPNAGSWAPMTILTGDDSFGAGLTAVAGFPFGEQRQRQRAAEMPGLMQLQAGLTDRGLDRESAWREMAERDLAAARQAYAWHLGDGVWRNGPYAWAIPPQAVLDQALALRQRLDAQAPVLRALGPKLALVLGEAPETPDGVAWDSQGTLAYTTTAQGDGRVPWASTLLPDAPTYRVAASHGDLPKTRDAFELYRALLQGEAVDSRWQFRPPAARSGPTSGAVAGPSRPAHRPGGMAPASRGGAVALEDLMRGFGRAGRVSEPGERSLPPVLKVRVVHGDVAAVEEPLLMGHTRSLALTGSETVVNQALGGVLEASLRLRQYPEDPGQQAVFVNRHVEQGSTGIRPRPEAAIVVGLGHEGDPTLASLRKEVRSGVLAYARHLWSQGQGREEKLAPSFSLAALLMGSGSSVSVRDAACALAGGVLDANKDLSERPVKERWPLVGELKVVDIYLDRASEAWRTLMDLSEELNARLQVDPAIEEWVSGRARPPGVGYRGASHDLVRVTTGPQRDETVPCPPGGPAAEVRLEYSMFTRRARSEVRGKSTQGRLVEPMIAAAQGQTSWNAELSRSLYRLLLPQELQMQFSAGNALLLELDPASACYPWELLDDGPGPDGSRSDGEPLTVRRSGGLLRKLRLTEFRRRPSDALVGERMVVIGVPKLSDERYPPLPAAADEARAVAEVLGVTALLDAPPIAVTTAVLAQPCRVLHLAGHGHYDAKGLGSGMLMDQGSVLGPREFDSMDVVPELVFINCCHLGRIEADEAMPRHLFAANVAEQLMRNGVLCVVAAGWAVRDEAAAAFARAFYRALLAGQRFQDAVAQARRAAYQVDPGGNTWAAYQCYGDPDWRLAPGEPVQQDPHLALTKPLPDVPSRSEMVLLVDELRHRAIRANARQRADLLADLNRLVAAQGARFAQKGQVLEAVGMAYQSLHEKQLALDFLGRACRADDGRASLRAREQWLNMRSRLADGPDDLRQAIDGLHHLIDFGPTSERWSLVGSAWKRMLIRFAGGDRPALDRAAQIDALDKMEAAFRSSLALDPPKRHFPMAQVLAAELRKHWLSGSAAPAETRLRELQRAVRKSQASELEFWDLVAGIEANLLRQLCLRDKAHPLDLQPLCAAFETEHQRHAVPHAWESVYDNARFLLEGQAQAAGWTSDEGEAARRLLEQLRAYADGG